MRKRFRTRRVSRELRADDRGQTSVEYLGIIAVVVAIILVLTTTDFGTMIATAITNQIQRITG
ncbi:Flp family type IVb pilin [Streptomyces triculaminicus]|uniref:Flp family type IVb pilin n=1 Tax=Streptomyces triculaminicus TaxID=2816232 RepID=UPI0037D596ED